MKFIPRLFSWKRETGIVLKAHENMERGDAVIKVWTHWCRKCKDGEKPFGTANHNVVKGNKLFIKPFKTNVL
jgi:hypothetical protein